MKLKKLLSLTLAALLTLSLVSCAGKDNSSTPNTQDNTDTNNSVQDTPEEKAIDTFIVGTTAEITTANRAEYNFDVISGTLSQLAPVWLDENGEFQPLLCDYSTEDSKIWTLTVRDGMTWHDGQPVTAEDIKFTLEYLDTQTDGGYADSYADIRIMDESTIELELETPNPRQLSTLTTLRIMPKHIYEGVEDYTTVPNEQANIGCGPYKYTRFDPDAGIVEFTAFEEYPDGAPKAKTVILKLFDNADTMYMSLKSGDIDMIYKYSGGVDPTVVDDLSSVDTITLQPVSSTANSACLIFNNNAFPGNNESIRKAIVNAIDYDQFRTLFGSAYAKASNAGFIPEGSYGYIETPQLSRDLDKARELLAQAGCTDSDSDGFVEYNGEKVTLEVLLRSDKPEHARYAELLKNNLAEIGIDVVLNVQEVAAFRELTEQQKAHTAVITGLTAYGMSMKQGMASLYMAGKNSMGYGEIYDDAYLALLDNADTAATMDEYKAVAAEIQEYYAEALPAVAFFWDSHIQAYQSVYSGFVTDATFGIMNVQTWMNLASK